MPFDWNEKIENLVLKAEECSRKNCIYVYVFKIFSVSIRKIRNSNIASITFKNPKTIYIYTVLAWVKEALLLILDFLFEWNEKTGIKIYTLKGNQSFNNKNILY